MKIWQHVYEKKIEKNQNNKGDYKKKTRKLWKWMVIGGNFFYYQQNNKLSYISVLKYKFQERI